MKYNFKTIKNLSSQLLFENMITTNTDLSYNKFLNEVKKSPVLKTQFIVYTNIENESFTDKSEAQIFLQENLNYFNKFTKADILSANEKVSKIFKTDINEAEDPLFDLILECTKDRKVSGVVNKAKLFSQIVNKLTEQKPVLTEERETVLFDPAIPIKKIIKRATEIVNETYSFFDEKEKNILKAFINEDDNEKEELYNNLINENLNLVKRKLYNEENYEKEELESLNLTEEKLKNSPYSKDIQIGEFSKLISLQETLRG